MMSIEKKQSYIWNRAIITIASFSLFIVNVSAQAQEDVNPNFDASNEDEVYINYNYDCSNIPWPKDTGDVYRRVTKTEDQKNPIEVSTYLIGKNQSILELEKQGIFGAKVTESDGTVGMTTTTTSSAIPKYDIKTTPNPALLLPTPTIAAADSDLAGKVVCQFTGLKEEEEIVANLVPPTLQQLENYFVKFLYLFWAFIGIFSVFNLMKIGFELLTNAGNKVRYEDSITKLRSWVFGLIASIVGIPALYFIFDMIDIQTTDCFCYYDEKKEMVYDLTLPGFTFFFKDVCTGPASFGVPDANNCDEKP